MKEAKPSAAVSTIDRASTTLPQDVRNPAAGSAGPTVRRRAVRVCNNQVSRVPTSPALKTMIPANATAVAGTRTRPGHSTHARIAAGTALIHRSTSISRGTRVPRWAHNPRSSWYRPTERETFHVVVVCPRSTSPVGARLKSSVRSGTPVKGAARQDMSRRRSSPPASATRPVPPCRIGRTGR